MRNHHQRIARLIILLAAGFISLGAAGTSSRAQEQQKQPVQEGTTIPEQDGPYRRTFLPQGSQDGALYFEVGFPGPHMTPHRFVIDGSGNSYFAERQVPAGNSGNRSSRVQKFSSAGKFLLQFDLKSLHEAAKKQAHFASLVVDNLFLENKDRILALVRVFNNEGHTTGVFVGVYDAGGRLRDTYRLAVTEWPDGPIETGYLDTSGHLWLTMPGKLTVFDPKGAQYNASDRPPDYVDLDGHRYLGGEVFGRGGEKVATLAFPPETGPVKITGGDPRTFLYARAAESAGDRGRMLVFRLDKKNWRLSYAGEVVLPRTRVSYRGGGDYNVPIEESGSEDLTSLRGNQLVMLWYSAKQYWLLTIDVPDYLEQYGYLSKYVRFLRDDVDLAGLSTGDLRFLRNEIYARHGRTFTSRDLQEYFAKQPWYKPDPGYTDSSLFSLERELVERLGKIEKQRAAEKK